MSLCPFGGGGSNAIRSNGVILFIGRKAAPTYLLGKPAQTEQDLLLLFLTPFAHLHPYACELLGVLKFSERNAAFLFVRNDLEELHALVNLVGKQIRIDDKSTAALSERTATILFTLAQVKRTEQVNERPDPRRGCQKG